MSQQQSENENERVLQGIRLRILHRDFSVGEKIPERSLAEEFQVSRSPVRYAIQQLIIEGLVARVAGNEAVVIGMRREDRVDFDELMTALDLLAFRQAIVRADDERLLTMRSFVEESCSSDRLKSQEDIVDFLHKFRTMVVESSENSILLEINEFFDNYYLKWNFEGILIDEVKSLSLKFVQCFTERDFKRASEIYECFKGKIRSRTRAQIGDFLRRSDLPSLEEVNSMTIQHAASHDSPARGQVEHQLGSVSIAEKVRQEIYAGLRNPGDTLSARLLAEDFGVSRTPAQQAIDQLIADRLVDDAGPRRSARIRKVDVSEINDILDVALALDCYAMKLATQRRDAYDLNRLKQGLADQVDCAANGENRLQAVAEIMNFRQTLLKASKNRFILSANKVIEARLRWHLSKLQKYGLLARSNYLVLESIINRDEATGTMVFETFFDLALREDYLNGNSGFTADCR